MSSRMRTRRQKCSANWIVGAQAAEDIEAVGYVVKKWRNVLDGKTGKEIASI